MDPVRFTPPTGETWPPVAQWSERDWVHFLVQHRWTEEAALQYVRKDRFQYGFGLKRSAKDEWVWFYHPIPHAVPFHASKAPNILYGGAAGGAKSTSARWDAYRHCYAIPHFTALIMRRTHQELKRNHMRFVVREATAINRYLGREVMDWAPTEFELRFTHNGSVILFGHCQNIGDEEKYLSDEYDAFYPDEVATFTKEQILGVASRLRSTKPGLKPRLGATSNPGGTHTLWCRDYFIDKQVSLEENPRYNADEWQYIHARLYDNPYLMDPDGTFTTYENRLYARGEVRRRQLLEGDWSALTGQFFGEFSNRHAQVLAIPKGTRLERWLDWGYIKPGVCYWVAILSSGRLYVFHEYVFKETIASEVAKRILEETRLLLKQIPGARVSRTIADPSMFLVQGHTGESYAETFGRFGVPCVEGDNDRILGWGRVRHWLADAPDGVPWLLFKPAGSGIGNGCPYALRTIPSLISDAHDPEDVNTHGEDHAADAVRYGAMARPTPVEFGPTKDKYLPDSIAVLLERDRAVHERRTGMVR